jgi:hypothetical protein
VIYLRQPVSKQMKHYDTELLMPGQIWRWQRTREDRYGQPEIEWVTVEIVSHVSHRGELGLLTRWRTNGYFPPDCSQDMVTVRGHQELADSMCGWQIVQGDRAFVSMADFTAVRLAVLGITA